MINIRLFLIAACLFVLLPFSSHADEPWLAPGADGQPEVQLYFFWSLTCPHCTEAHPYIESIPKARPWVRLHALEVSRDSEKVPGTGCANCKITMKLIEDSAGEKEHYVHAGSGRGWQGGACGRCAGSRQDRRVGEPSWITARQRCSMRD